jgi:hypothetical protein
MLGKEHICTPLPLPATAKRLQFKALSSTLTDLLRLTPPGGLGSKASSLSCLLPILVLAIAVF